MRFVCSDHSFPEEREPSGRLVLAPCLTCGISAMDAMDALRLERDRLHSPATGDARGDRERCAKKCDEIAVSFYEDGRVRSAANDENSIEDAEDYWSRSIAASKCAAAIRALPDEGGAVKL